MLQARAGKFYLITGLTLLLVQQSFYCCESQPLSKEIVLINVGNRDRASIAKQISIISSCNPKVIAIDILFTGDTKRTKDDSLFSALLGCSNLVLSASIGEYSHKDLEYKYFLEESSSEFLTKAKIGFINVIPRKDKQRTIDKIATHVNFRGGRLHHFAVEAAMAYDSLKAIRFLEKNPRIISADFISDLRFEVLSEEDFLQREFPCHVVEGKIVMFGFLGPGDEDKFFTPMNSRTKPFQPDMYGLVFLARIVQQILGDK